MTVIREDAEGLHVKAGGYIARPGPVIGFSTAFRMDDGGLEAGMVCKARHVAGSQLTRIVTPSGEVLHWHHEGPERDRKLIREDLPEAGTESAPGGP